MNRTVVKGSHVEFVCWKLPGKATNGSHIYNYNNYMLIDKNPNFDHVRILKGAAVSHFFHTVIISNNR